MPDGRIWILAAGVGLVLAHTWYTNYEAEPEVGILAAGMSPQLDLIRDVASGHEWKVSCEGKAGEMTVLRLEPSFWTVKDSEAAIRDDLSGVASLTQDAKGSADSCDIDPPKLESIDSPARIAMAAGPRETLLPIREIARSCGFDRAAIEPIDSAEKRAHLVRIYGEISQEWLGLYIGKDDSVRYGPATCFGIMGSRYENGTAR